MLARLSCWKALFAAATRCVISASKVQSEVKTLPKYLKWDTTSSGSPRSVMTESAMLARFVCVIVYILQTGQTSAATTHKAT